MNVPFFDIQRQLDVLRNDIDLSIREVIDSGYFINSAYVEEFESAFANYIGTKHCVGCGNGTDAIELALEALGVKQEDEVIVPNHTWTSTASAVTRNGASPICAKCSEIDFTIDPLDIEKQITKDTKAIICVHLYGNPCDLIALKKIADKFNLFLIEDCAQAHGAEIHGQKVGSFGDIATFSFYPSKNLGCFGDGGCITTNNYDIDKSIREIKNCGQISKNKHVVPGRNSRLDDIQAAILKVKLPYLDEWNELRIEAANLYKTHLKHPAIEFQQVKESHKNVYHIFSIRTKYRDQLKIHLETQGIGTGLHYPNALSKMEFYQSNNQNVLNNQEYIDELLSLPMFPFISEKEIKYVCEQTLKFMASK